MLLGHSSLRSSQVSLLFGATDRLCLFSRSSDCRPRARLLTVVGIFNDARCTLLMYPQRLRHRQSSLVTSKGVKLISHSDPPPAARRNADEPASPARPGSTSVKPSASRPP